MSTMPDPTLVRIGSDQLSAAINPLGAELWSLTDGQGREYMTDADPAYWSGRAPLLFPIVGALNEDLCRIDGAEHPLPKHGFARRSLFAVIEQGPDRATFRLTDSAATRAAWPFRFALDMAFRIEGDVLRQVATLRNPADTPLWFSFGFHPAFAWPLPGGAAKADHRVTFAVAEPGPVRRLDPPSGLVLPDPQPSPVVGRTLWLDAGLFEPDALIWDQLASRSLTYGAEQGARLEIGFPDTPLLGIWQKPGAAFLCIEPWQGIADPQGWHGEFRDKPGVVELAGGTDRSFRMDVRVVPPPA